MDPKSFAHLDPKLKETYARVMGTTTGTNDAPQNVTAPSDPSTQSLTPTPDVSANPTDQPAMLSSSPDIAPPPPMQDNSAPPNSSFFSNPSPATSELSQTPSGDGLSSPVQPQPAEQTPVTPYTPDVQTVTTGESFSQPLPSPSSVTQGAPHETSALLKVLYIVGGAIFLAVYTIFWIKVFNLPFLF